MALAASREIYAAEGGKDPPIEKAVSTDISVQEIQPDDPIFDANFDPVVFEVIAVPATGGLRLAESIEC